LHLSVVGWPIDGAGDGVEMGTGRLLSECCFPTFEHVHGITEFPIRPAECRSASVSRMVWEIDAVCGAS
jgi:hypothetical protein